MTTDTLSPEALVLELCEPFRFTADQYHALYEAGILPERGVELIGGQVLMSGHLRPWHFTVGDYYTMLEIGVLDEDSHVELLHGQIIAMSPIGSLHASLVGQLTELFYRAIKPGEAVIRVQDPLRIGDMEPEPDVMLLRFRRDRYRQRHPAPSDVRLLVEVSVSTLLKDRRVKLPLYAAHGVREVWLVVPETGTVEVHREPTGDGYARVAVLERGDELTAAAFPALRFAVTEVFAPLDSPPARSGAA